MGPVIQAIYLFIYFIFKSLCNFYVNVPVTYLLILLYVSPEEGLSCKPKYRANCCYIHFFTLRISSSVSFFKCRKDHSFRIFFLGEGDPGRRASVLGARTRQDFPASPGLPKSLYQTINKLTPSNKPAFPKDI